MGEYFLYLPIAITEMLYYVLVIKESITIDGLRNDANHIAMHKMEVFICVFCKLFYDASSITIGFVCNALL